jgi:hypothetical protein
MTARALPAEITLHFSRERARLVRAALLVIARLHDTPRQVAEQAKVIDAYVARELLRPASGCTCCTGKRRDGCLW